VRNGLAVGLTMSDRDPRYVEISEMAIVTIMLIALGAFLLFSFFDSWGPILRRLR
jgi:hypothetical protein